MGYSQADKARTHERIVQIAAQRMREQGLDGIGVAELMKEAGLTVGGFYKHFASRDELVAEAMQCAFDTSTEEVQALLKSKLPPGYRRFVEGYLNPLHRDRPGIGCSFSSLAGDLARSDPKTRALASAQLQSSFEKLSDQLGGPQDGAARAKAILAYSAVVGAMALARILDDDTQSREVLDVVREQLLELEGQ